MFAPSPEDPFGANIRRFTPPTTIEPYVPSPINPPDTGLISLRSRKTPAMDEYSGYLANAPRREDYQTGKIGKVLAAIAGFGEGYTSKSPARAFDTTRGIIDRPYEEASTEYARHGGRLKELSELEYRSQGDEAKLELEIGKAGLANRKQILDEIQAASGIKLNEARVKDFESRINQRGETIQKNEVTGQLEVVNTVTKVRVPLGQFMQTPEAKADLEHKFFNKREAVQQKGREKLQGNAQAHAVKMEGLRFGNDKNLAKFRQELQNNAPLSPTQSNAAFDGAYQEILTLYPDMKDRLFEADANGNLTLRKDFNQDAFDMFKIAVQEKMKEKMGKPNTLNPSIPEPNPIMDSAIPDNVPQVQDPSSVALRQAAIQFLVDNNFDEADEENIANAMKKISEESSVSQNIINPNIGSNQGNIVPPQGIARDPNSFFMPGSQSNMNSMPPRSPMLNPSGLIGRDYPINYPEELKRAAQRMRTDFSSGR